MKPTTGDGRREGESKVELKLEKCCELSTRNMRYACPIAHWTGFNNNNIIPPIQSGIGSKALVWILKIFPSWVEWAADIFPGTGAEGGSEVCVGLGWRSWAGLERVVASSVVNRAEKLSCDRQEEAGWGSDWNIARNIATPCFDRT